MKELCLTRSQLMSVGSVCKAAEMKELCLKILSIISAGYICAAERWEAIKIDPSHPASSSVCLTYRLDA